jgi:hypothetical protein
VNDQQWLGARAELQWPGMTMSDALEAQRRRNAGLAAAENGREWLLDQAQRCARQACSAFGEVTSDDVASFMSARGLDYSALGNAAGSVFKGMAWTGRVVRSERPSTHGRIIRVWRLK